MPHLTLVLAVALAMAGHCADVPGNIAKNSSFEEVYEDGMPLGWDHWLKALPEPGCISVDETFAHSGKRSLRLRHTTGAHYTMMSQQVDFAPNRHYLISAWIKGDDIKPGEGSMHARLYIGLEGGNGFTSSSSFTGTFDWTHIEIGPFDVKERTWLSLIPYLHNCTGTVWYDDITFREVPPAEMKLRAQQRARDRALTDLKLVEQAAQDAAAQDLQPRIDALRQRLAAAEDLPETLSPRGGPPYFPLHEQVYALMAGVNQHLWAKLRNAPPVYARWADPFSDAAPLQPAPSGADGVPWLVEMLRDETEQACARLTNLTAEAQQVGLKLSGLKTKTGEDLHPAAITWRELRCVDTREGVILPDPLVKLGNGAGPFNIALPPGMTKDIWLMVDSKGVAPGQYEGTLSVTAGNAPAQTLLLTVFVYPVDYPDTLPMHTFAYAYTTWELLKDRVEMSRADLIKHRINTYVIHGAFTPWPVFDEAGEWQGLNWDKMDAQFALHPGAKCILLWPGLEIGDRVDKLSPPDGPRYPSAEWATYAARWGKELAEGMKQRGFARDQWALYLVDEPSTRRAQIARAAGDAVHAGAPDVRIFENPYGAASERDMKHMGPAVDIWCPSLDTAHGERLDFCRESAEEVWMYQVLGKTSDPLKSFRLAYWEAYQKDLRGFGFWDYANCGGSVWDPFDSRNHDYAVVYDGDESELIPSKRWEAYREGAEDHAMLSMLAALKDNPEAQRLVQESPARVLESADAETLRLTRREMIRLLAAAR